MRDVDPAAHFYGMYRGFIEDVSDPEQRGRYRVRVPMVHPDEIKTDCIPWAEICAFGGRSFGDIPNYDIGDPVWVEFEGGDRLYPVVLGGWVSLRQGINDLLPEQTEDYDTTRKRWTRVDRKNNLIEMSELPGERHIRLQSGNAEVRITQLTDSIILKTKGDVQIEGKKIGIESSQTLMLSDDLILQAAGYNGEDRDGHLRLFSNHAVHIFGSDTLSLGQYVANDGKVWQGAEINMRPRHLQLGSSYENETEKRTMTVTIDAFNEVVVKSPHKVTITAPVIDLKASGEINIEAGRRIRMQAPRIEQKG